ncbi:MAG: histidine kinase [Chloroflexota bacterium]
MSFLTFVRTFFELNRDIIFFVYGLVFFVLGLAIALQSRRYSRLDLARSLPWLAGFGFVHGFHEWGDLFVPIQAAYLGPPLIQGLHVLHLLLLGVSFACLMEFGVSLMQSLGWARWLHAVPAGLLATWIFLAFFLLPSRIPDVDSWHNTANALARYAIGFPGALLAAFGLRRQAFQRIAPLNVPQIVRVLRVAGLTLVGYAILGGLFPPPVPFFPGNLINTAVFEQVFTVPPMVFRSLLGLILAVTIIRALEVFEVETARLIEGMEQQQILAAERERIGRELHDGAIQKVYTAGLLVESAQKLAPAETPVAGRLDKAVAVLNDALADLRHNLGQLRPSGNNSSLANGLRRLVEDPRFSALIDLSLDLKLPEADGLSPMRTDHVLAIANEALSNVMRHAQAQHAAVSAVYAHGRLRLTIQDDGIGGCRLDGNGYGLRNMRDRARLLGGRLEVVSESGRGTTIRLDVPWQDPL